MRVDRQRLKQAIETVLQSRGLSPLSDFTSDESNENDNVELS